jgi:hypothetical protein
MFEQRNNRRKFLKSWKLDLPELRRTLVALLLMLGTPAWAQDTLWVDCNRRRCAATIQDYIPLKYIDRSMQAYYWPEDGTLTVEFSGINEDDTSGSRYFTFIEARQARNHKTRKRKLSSVKTVCVIGSYSKDALGGVVCTDVRKRFRPSGRRKPRKFNHTHAVVGFWQQFFGTIPEIVRRHRDGSSSHFDEVDGAYLVERVRYREIDGCNIFCDS